MLFCLGLFDQKRFSTAYKKTIEIYLLDFCVFVSEDNMLFISLSRIFFSYKEWAKIP